MQGVGLVYGLVAGGGLAVAIWGTNSALFLQSAAWYPWILPLMCGLVACLVGGLAGWVSARQDSALVSGLVWMAAGLLIAWMAVQANFRWINQAAAWLYPEFQGLRPFPFESYADLMQTLVLIMIGFVSTLAGVFQLFIIEASFQASSSARKIVLLLVNFVLFASVGLVVDYIVQRPLREPISVVSHSFTLARQAQLGDLSEAAIKDLHLRAFKPLAGLIDQPVRLSMGAYDPDSIMTGSVHLNFDGLWSTCNVVEGSLSYCDLSSALYIQRLGCYLGGGSPESCRLKISDPGSAVTASLNQPPEQPLRMEIEQQLGDIVSILVENQDSETFRCILRLRGDVVLESCQPLK